MYEILFINKNYKEGVGAKFWGCAWQI